MTAFARLLPWGSTPRGLGAAASPTPLLGIGPLAGSGDNAPSPATDHRCGPPAEPTTNYADAARPGLRHVGGLDSLACSRCGRSPLGGRAIVLSSRSGGTERFLGRRPLVERQSVGVDSTTGGPRRAVWHRLGCDGVLSRSGAVMPTMEPSRCGQVMPGAHLRCARARRWGRERRQDGRSACPGVFVFNQVGGP